MKFTQLETAALEAICVNMRDTLPRLDGFISSAVVVSRENTGHGFYTYFDTHPAIADSVWPSPIGGPDAYMLGLGENAIMGFLLWCSGNEPSALEGFQYGDAKGETVDLKRRDLAKLRFHHLEWSIPSQ